MVDYTRPHLTRGEIIDMSTEMPLATDVAVAILVLYEGEATPMWTVIDNLPVFAGIELCRNETACMRCACTQSRSLPLAVVEIGYAEPNECTDINMAVAQVHDRHCECTWIPCSVRHSAHAGAFPSGFTF